MFLPLEKTYAPFNFVLMSITVRATYSFSSSWQPVPAPTAAGATKYRQISGTSVISGMLWMGICSACTSSKPLFEHRFALAARRVVVKETCETRKNPR